MATSVRIEMKGRTAVVTLDRPPANAMNHETCAELCAAGRRVRAPEVAAVVLTGAGRFFSAGLDLFEIFEYPDDEARAFATSFDDAVASWFSLDKPVVAAVNGHAVAGGAVMAAAADFRLLADGEHRMGLTEILLGVTFPTSALEVVRFSCAGPRLPELLYRGQTYGPEEAIAARLADELVPAAQVMARALALSEELGALAGPAFAASKAALRFEHLERMRAARAHGSDPVWERWRDPAVRERVERYRAATLRKK